MGFFRSSIGGVGKLGAELREAVAAGDADKVKRFLDEGADVNAQDKGGVTLLMIASKNGHGNIVETLLADGAKANVKINLGIVGLGGPTSSGLSATLINALPLIYRNLVTMGPLNGVTALMIASNHGHDKIVKMLLAEGAKVDAKNNNGMTALMFASKNGHDKVVTMLLAEGAEVNAKGINGMTALAYASQEGHSVVVDLLLK